MGTAASVVNQEGSLGHTVKCTIFDAIKDMHVNENQLVMQLEANIGK